jgi:hypothetical protein
VCGVKLQTHNLSVIILQHDLSEGRGFKPKTFWLSALLLKNKCKTSAPCQFIFQFKPGWHFDKFYPEKKCTCMYVVSYWSNKVSTSIHIFFIGIQKSNTYSKGRELDYAFCRVGKKMTKSFFLVLNLSWTETKAKNCWKQHFILSTNLFSLKR